MILKTGGCLLTLTLSVKTFTRRLRHEAVTVRIPQTLVQPRGNGSQTRRSWIHGRRCQPYALRHYIFLSRICAPNSHPPVRNHSLFAFCESLADFDPDSLAACIF